MNLIALVCTILYGGGWIRTYRCETAQVAYCVQQTADGGYIMVGYKVLRITEPDAESELWLVKTDENGDTLWTKTYGKPYCDDGGSCIRQTFDGGYIVTGFTDGPRGKTDLWLLKTKANGDTLWTKVYGSKWGGYNDEGCWVEQTPDGGYIVTGEYEGAYVWLLKTNNKGDTLWTQKWDLGAYHDIGKCVRRTVDGGYILATSAGLMKTNSKGDSLWLKPWAGNCVEETEDYGFIVAGNKDKDVWLIKTDWMGDTVWTKTYGGEDEEYSYYVQQTIDGGYVVLTEIGSFGSDTKDIWLIKTSSGGDTLWTRVFGGIHNDCASCTQQTIDNGYIVCGATYSGSGFLDVLLIKTDSLGYAGIEEPVKPPAQTDWQVVSPVGPTVTLRYSNLPQGFYAFVFDASGRKVDEIEAQGESGTISWGVGKNPGVYFIKANSPNILATKVVLLK